MLFSRELFIRAMYCIRKLHVDAMPFLELEQVTPWFLSDKR